MSKAALKLNIGGNVMVTRRNTQTGKTEVFEQQNLLLDDYLNKFFSNSIGILDPAIMHQCYLGIGNTPPDPSDTGLSGDILASSISGALISEPVITNVKQEPEFNQVSASGYSYGCAYSPNGQYFAVAHSYSPYVTVYKRDEFMLTKLSGVPALVSTGNDCAFSPDSTYLAVAHDVSPYVTIYKRSGDAFEKIENPVNELPAGDGSGVSWSPDGIYLAVSHSNSPYFTIYRRDGDNFTKLATPADLPNHSELSGGCAFSPNGQLLAVWGGYGTSSTTRGDLSVYERVGDVFTRVFRDTGVSGTGKYIRDGAWSPNGDYFAHCASSTSYTVVYRLEGTNFTSVFTSSSYYVRSLIFSPDAKHLILVQSSEVTILAKEGDTFTQVSLSNSSEGLSSSAGCDISPDGTTLAVVGRNSYCPAQFRLRHSNYTTYLKRRWTFPAGVGTGVVRELALQANPASPYDSCWVARQVLNAPIEKDESHELIVDWTIGLSNPTGASGIIAGGSRDGSDVTWTLSLNDIQLDRFALQGQWAWFGLGTIPRIFGGLDNELWLNTDYLLEQPYYKGQLIEQVDRADLVRVEPYVNNSLQRWFSVTLTKNDINGVIGELVLRNDGDYDLGRFTFNPPLDKVDTFRLDLDFTLGLQRG